MTLLQRATEIRDIYRRYATDPHKFIESQRKLDALLDSAEKLITQEKRLAAQEKQLAEQAKLIAELQDMIKKQTRLAV